MQGVVFALASLLIAGVNLYALGLVLKALLGWPQWCAIPVAALVVLSYTRSSADCRRRSTTRCCSSS